MNCSEYRNSWLFKELRISDERLVQNKIHIVFSPGLSEHCIRTGGKNIYESEAMEGAIKYHLLVNSTMDLQLLKLPTMGLHKNGLVNSQSWTEVGLTGSYPSLLNCLLLIESGVVWVLPSVVHPPVNAPGFQVVVTWKVLVKLNELQNKTKRHISGKGLIGRRGGWSIWEGYRR